MFAWRKVKTDIEALDARGTLERVVALPVSQWRYTNDAAGTVRIGPMAEDFQAVFGLGDGKHISASDMGGIALASVQGLYRELQERDREIARLQQDNTALRAEVMHELQQRDAEIARLQRDNAELREGLARDNRELTERLAALEQLLLGREELAQH